MNRLSLGNVNVDGSVNITFARSSYTPQEASELISTMDTIYSIVFLLFILAWSRQVARTVEDIDAAVSSMSDYSVRWLKPSPSIPFPPLLSSLPHRGGIIPLGSMHGHIMVQEL